MTSQHAMTPLYILSVILAMTAVTECADWAYGGGAEEAWKELYPLCGRSSQSPVDLTVQATTKSPRLAWSSYNLKPHHMILTNNGHSLVVTAAYPTGALKPRIKIAEDKVYELVNVHFHWGRTNFLGSEHTLRGTKYPLEMHAVHTRVVGGVKSEILVVGVLFQIASMDHPALQHFINNAKKVITAETEYHMEPFKWSDLIPEVNGEYYTYQGSLTTPPCTEGVTWVVRSATEVVSSAQMELFRLMENDEGNKLSGNFRPVQPLYGRQINYVTL